MYNWTYLKNNFDVTLIKEDIRYAKQVEKASDGVDVAIYTAAQTAVTTLVLDSRTDFEINAMSTFNVLEASRKPGVSMVYCSTNKVHGDNVNKIEAGEKDTRYEFTDMKKGSIKVEAL